jgi:hypothetical protein
MSKNEESLTKLSNKFCDTCKLLVVKYAYIEKLFCCLKKKIYKKTIIKN